MYKRSWASLLWIYGSPEIKVTLQHARHGLALRQMVSEFAFNMSVGDHPYVLGALGWHIDEDGSNMLDSVAMVTPYVAQTVESFVYRDGGDLASWRLLAEARTDIIMDLCGALQHLRSRDIVALDLRPTNIAMGAGGRDSFTAAIVSLKHAFEPGHVLTAEEVESLSAVYTAPPVKAGDVVQPGMDSWALGVFMWEMIMGFKPVAGVVPGGGNHSINTNDATSTMRWMFAEAAATDRITHDALTMLFLPLAEQRPTPAEVHEWMKSLKAVIASDEYQEIAADLADGTKVQEMPHIDMTASTSLRREECLATCSAHMREAENVKLLAQYHAHKIGGALGSLVVASSKACEEVARAAAMPEALPRWRMWAQRAATKARQAGRAPAIASASAVLVRCCL